MAITVRLAGPGDGPALASLRWRWRADERGETGMGRGEFVDELAVWLSEHSQSHLAWVAETGPVPVGMAWLAVIHRMPGPGNWLRLAGNLQSVYVVPEHRGSGVGGLLVGAAIERARTIGLEYISVHPSERSFPLYQRHGLRESSGVLELRGEALGRGP